MIPLDSLDSTVSVLFEVYVYVDNFIDAIAAFHSIPYLPIPIPYLYPLYLYPLSIHAVNIVLARLDAPGKLNLSPLPLSPLLSSIPLLASFSVK